MWRNRKSKKNKKTGLFYKVSVVAGLHDGTGVDVRLALVQAGGEALDDCVPVQTQQTTTQT